MKALIFLICLGNLMAGEYKVDYELDGSKIHSKFSSKIEPILRAPSGSVIRAQTREATDGQFTPQSTVEALATLDLNRVHPLTGPVYIEGAKPGDTLAVTILDIELSDWGWAAIVPGLGLLSDEFNQPYLKHFRLNKKTGKVAFNDKIELPLNPFPGVMGVAPATEEMLSTIPPRANGGNLDDPHLIPGTTVYFPVFVEGALFSIGDPHATQGLGEVCGTAIESPLEITYRIELIKGGRKIPETQYETDDFYATTGFATTIDEAAKKATRFMVDYLAEVHALSRTEAYVLCSLAGNLHIAETVDIPHMLVTMHMPKSIFKK